MRPLAGLACALAASIPLWADTPQRAAGRATSAPTAEVGKCAADLGAGVNSGRRFCDVIMTASPVESIMATLAPHRSPVRLQFDLHNRFAVPPIPREPAQAFARHSAVVAVVGPKAEIGRAVVVGEYRTPTDLFDRLAGGAGPGGVKAVAPGSPTAVEMTIPAGINSVGIVGVRIEMTTRLGTQIFDTPGRPIAMLSNLRIDTSPVR